MHPAFQGPNGTSNSSTDITAKRGDPSHPVYPSTQTVPAGIQTPPSARDDRQMYSLGHGASGVSNHPEDSNSSDLSDGSEEIDLTTNGGCIDYSNSGANRN